MSWAMIGAAGSIGAGYLGNKTRQTSPGTPGGYMVAPQYSFTEPRLRLMSDFASDNITRAGRGEAPAYFERGVGKMRQGLERGVQTTYFGRAGDRTGSVQAGLEAGAIAGTGSRPGTANVNKALQRYEEAGLSIEEFIAKECMRSTEESIKTSMYYGSQIPGGPESQYITGYPAQTTEGSMPWLSSMASMVGNNPNMLGDIGDLFGGGGWKPQGYGPGYQLPGADNVPGGVAPPDYYLNQTSAAAPTPTYAQSSGAPTPYNPGGYGWASTAGGAVRDAWDTAGDQLQIYGGQAASGAKSIYDMYQAFISGMGD